MFGDFVDESELEQKRTSTGEMVEEENEGVEDEEVFEESYSDESYDEDTDDEDKTAYQILMEDLVDKGVLFADEEKDYDINEDGIEELLEDTINARLRGTFEENPDLAMLYDVVQNGGSIQDVMQIYGEVNYSELDMEDADTRVQVVIDYYTAKGLSESRINKLIETSMDDGSFEDEVVDAHNALVYSQRAEMQQYLNSLEERNVAEQEYAMEQMVDLRHTINNIEEIQGFKLDKRTKDNFFNYMTQPTRDGTTQLQQDAQDREKQLVMAFMYYTNFNSEDLQRRATTNVSEKLSKALKSQQDINVRSSSSGSKRRSNIDDYDDIII
jgi:hypothetical protein